MSLKCNDKSFMQLNDLKNELKFLFISSDVELLLDDRVADPQNDAIKIDVSKSDNSKCDRCWHFVDNLIHQDEKLL